MAIQSWELSNKMYIVLMAKTWEVVKTALTAIPQLTIMEKLDVGLTLSELQKAINCLAMKRLLEAMAVVLRRTFQKDSQFCSTLHETVHMASKKSSL